MATKTVDHSAVFASTGRSGHAPIVLPFPGQRLVLPSPPPVCVETVEALEQLIDGACNGRHVGIAFAVTTNGREYTMDATGEFLSDPTYARGALATLDDKLGEHIYDISV